VSVEMSQSAGRASHRRSGFTLVELMIVVATIGVIASMASPNLKRYMWRTERSEAMVNLNYIYISQAKHFSDYGRYADTFAELGFEIPGGLTLGPQTVQGQYYTYTVDAFQNVAGLADGNFQALATGDRDPSDAMLDILMIENELIIVE
jgi:prepilin-type N-terminal cleavage/methylation domain-containing protein